MGNTKETFKLTQKAMEKINAVEGINQVKDTKALEDLIGKIAAIKWNGGYDRNGSHDAGEYVDYEGAIGEVLNHDQMHAIVEWADAQLAEYKAMENRVLEFGQKLDFERGETISAVKVIHQAEKHLAERDAQLAAYHGAVSRHLPPKYEIADGLLWIPNGKGGWTTGDEITPKYRAIALEAIKAYEAIRQPTRDKGE